MYIHVCSMVEEEGAERLAKVGRELEEVREHSKILETQVSNLKVPTCTVYMYMYM